MKLKVYSCTCEPHLCLPVAVFLQVEMEMEDETEPSTEELMSQGQEALEEMEEQEEVLDMALLGKTWFWILTPPSPPPLTHTHTQVKAWSPV